MNKILLKNFKAFSNEIVLEPSGKNMLICGENGSGKSSLFEGLKLAYCREKMIAGLTEAATPEEERVQRKNDFLSKFNNKKQRLLPFTLLIDDVEYDQYDVHNIESYFVSGKIYKYYNEIALKDLLIDLNFDETQLEFIIKNWLTFVVDAINAALHSYFFEDVKISFLQEQGYKVRIEEVEKGLNEYENLSAYFNEAKLHLIVVLIMLSFAQVGFLKNESKTKILVVDDIVSSMDASNRELMIKYLLDSFKNTQLIVLTHNVSFFNLFSFMIENKDQWKFENLYVVGKQHYTYDYADNTVASLRQSLIDGEDPVKVGNRIRKRFENLIVEVARLRYVELNYDRLGNILDGLIQDKSVYVKKMGGRVYYSDTLVYEIEKVLKNVPEDKKLTKIQNAIDKYKENDSEYAPLRPVLKDLKLYQKVVLHQLSHGAQSYPTFSVKEESVVLDLLEKLEKFVDSGRNIHSAGDITCM